MRSTPRVDSDKTAEPKGTTERIVGLSAVISRLSVIAAALHQTKSRPRSFYISIVIVLLLSAAVRFLYWQDLAPDLSLHDTLSQNMALQYRREARRILEEGTLLYPRNHPDTDARMIVHPPGYSLVMALSFKLFGENDIPLRVLQLTADAISSVLVLLIAAEFFPFAVALVAGLLMALSPHLSYYAIKLSPDSLAVLPILMAVFLVIRATNTVQLRFVAAAGAMLGISCWFRANALLLAPLLAIVAAIMFQQGKRLRCATLLLATSVIIISPVTIRNWVIYHHFIPVAVPAGINLVQGIAELDAERRFGMPLFDRDVLEKDVEWNNRPEYGGNLWAPDGIERDRTRFNRGLDVIRSNPFWYAGAMLRRAKFMLSFSESRHRDWPFDTATVPPVTATPPFGQTVLPPNENDGSDSVTLPSALLAGGNRLSELTDVYLVNGENTLRIIGAGNDFEDQFLSSPFSVRRNTNYQLNLKGMVRQGLGAAKVVTPNRQIVLASVILPSEKEINETKSSKHPASGMTDLTPIVFASGDTEEVNLVFSDNGVSTERPVIEIAKVELVERGKTPTLWTQAPRSIIRVIEKNIYKTERLLPLILVGTCILSIARRRAMLILFTVPVYYVVSHSPFSTEYRYVLAIHCFLFISAAVTIYCAGVVITSAARHLKAMRLFSRSVTDAG